MCQPTGAAPWPTQTVLEILKDFSSHRVNEVVLVSGRDRETLQRWFGMFPISLVAEHGVWLRDRNEDWKMIKPMSNDWKPQILPILEMYSDRLPGSFVEEKEFSRVWHYRKAEPELGAMRAKDW
jgi:trehalose 6-phosphate synthase/phosphatase